MRRNQFNSIRKFEQLEERQMMAADMRLYSGGLTQVTPNVPAIAAADIRLNNGILTVQGTDNADNIRIEIDPNDSDDLIVTIKNDVTHALLKQGKFDLGDVDKIVVNGLNGDDEMYNYTDIRAEMFGGNGIDFITSGAGNDLIDGGAGDDRITGGRGNDRLVGGIGSDIYVFFDNTQLGADTIVEDASLDTDTLDFSFAAGPVNVNLASTAAQTVLAGNLTLTLSSSTGIENVIGTWYGDTIRGNSRNNVIYSIFGNDSLFGEGGDDELYGGGNSDSLYGGTGNDKLFGESGNDWLYGEAGLDTLDGGRDGFVDVLKGGSGADTFVKYKNRWSPFFDNEQKVTDYNSAVDAVLTVWY